MKIERDRKFVPITIILESLREAKIVLSNLVVGDSVTRCNFDVSDQHIVHILIKALRSEGIEER